ncbi:MAG: hypothetical protein Q8K30_06305 [Candidatus Gracilibacteria bacterium]|nr:hypothetical protein [Candidatus Gracilibacteria bacterium]MDP2396138.1 hypothetical protein [bacterium]MDP3381332.1 hypothetical protein [bacterium]
MNNLNEHIAVYKEQLAKGNIKIAYDGIVNFTTNLKTIFSKNLSDRFSFNGIFKGYMDYTYFYFTNDYLNDRKLKFGLVLNHNEMRFELWLLGQTKNIQKEYWDLLKSSKWNKDKTKMPKYAVLESVLIKNPDFNDLDLLSQNIEKNLIKVSDEIISELKKL